MRSLKTGLRFVATMALLTSMAGSMASCSKKEQKEEATKPPVVQEKNLGDSSEHQENTTVETEGLKLDDNVLKVGSEQVTYRETLIYLLQIKNKYEPIAGGEVWEQKISDKETFGEQAKQEVIDQITQIKIIKQEAAELKIGLEQDEVNEVEASARDYMSKITKEDQQKYGITQDMVQKVLEENYLAQKVYNIATNEVNTNISNDQAKQIKVQLLEVMTKGTDKEGNQIDLDEQKKKDAKKQAEKLREEALQAEDFSSFATSNTDQPEVELTFGKGDYPQIEEAAFALKQGEISNVIETDSGFVIVKLISAFDEEATNAKKEQIIEQERNKVFAEKYKTWSSGYKVTQDTSKWKNITFHI